MIEQKTLGLNSISLNGKDYVLKYDWRALGKLKSKFSDKNLESILSGREIDLLADVIAIGLERHHPEVTPDFVMDASPALVDALKSINDAITYAYFAGNQSTAGEKPEKKTKK